VIAAARKSAYIDARRALISFEKRLQKSEQTIVTINPSQIANPTIVNKNCFAHFCDFYFPF
jgi:hypothetical protein